MRNKTYSTMSERSYHGATSRSSLYQVLPVNDILASHRQERHRLCYTSCGALDEMRNNVIGPKTYIAP